MNTLQENIMAGRFFVSGIRRLAGYYIIVMDETQNSSVVTVTYYEVSNGEVCAIELDSSELSGECLSAISSFILNSDIRRNGISLITVKFGLAERSTWYCSTAELRKETLDRMYK